MDDQVVSMVGKWVVSDEADEDEAGQDDAATEDPKGLCHALQYEQRHVLWTRVLIDTPQLLLPRRLPL